MRYLLLMWDGTETPAPSAPDPDEEPCWLPWAREMEARGVLMPSGGRLELSAVPALVRTEDGEVLTTDGPFAETKEQMAGYQIIECASRADAIVAAAMHPAALQGGTVEVRELIDE